MNSSLNLMGVNVPFFAQIPISTNYVIADIRDPSSRNGSYTKTVRIPGTQAVNLLFEFVFELNIELSQFNPNKAVPAIYYTNSVEQFRGNLQILDIEVDFSTGINQVIYNCQITGETADIFRAINTKFLTDLDFSDMDHVFSFVPGLFSPAVPGTGYGYGYIDYGLANGNTTQWRFEHLKPYIFEKEYIDRIFDDAGFTYDSTFLNSATYKNTIIADVNEGAVKLAPSQIYPKQFYAGKTSSTTIGSAVGVGGGGFSYPPITSGTFVFNNDSTPPFGDPGGLYNTGTGIATIAIDTYNQVTASYDFKLTVTAPATAVTGQLAANINMKPLIRKNGTIITAALTPITNTYNVVAGEIVIEGTATVTRPGQLDLATSTFDSHIELLQLVITWRTAANIPVTVGSSTATLVVTGAKFYSSLTSYNLPLGDTVIMNTTIPIEIKQVDFLKSIFLAHNLYMEPSKTVRNHYIIEPEPQFKLTGASNTKDWTKKQDLKEGYVVVPMGELNAKTYLLTYKSDQDEYNKQYQNKYKEIYGQSKYEVDNDFTKNEKKIELIFSPTPGVSLGVVATDIIAPRFFQRDGNNIKPMKCNIRRLYYGGMKNCTTHNLIQGSSFNIAVSQYPYLGHLDDPSNPTYDLCFSNPRELYYITPGQTYTTANLNNLHWQKYLDEISDRDSKIVKAKMILNETDIKTFSFRNLIYVNGTYFYVNKITDYDPQVRKACNVELFKFKPGITPSNVAFVPFDPPVGMNNMLVANPNFNYLGNYNNPGNLAIGSNIINDSGTGVVTGNNVNVSPEAIDFDGIGMSGQSVGAEYSGKFAARNGALLLGDNGIDVLKYSRDVKTTNFTIDPKVPIYFVDASGGNILIKLPDEHTENGKFKLYRIDGDATKTVSVEGLTGVQPIRGGGTSTTTDLITIYSSKEYITDHSGWSF